MNNYKGFSLIEVIIASAMVISSLVIFCVALSTVPLTRTTRNQNIAYHIAAKKIEDLRRTAFASLPASGPFNDPGLSYLASSTASLTVADYQGSGEIKDISVTVNWVQQGATKNVILQTLISNTGLNP